AVAPQDELKGADPPMETNGSTRPSLSLAGWGPRVRSAMNRASARAAMLCAGDPAVAIATAVTYAGLFESAAESERRGGGRIMDKLPESFRSALAFAVSDTH